MEETNTAGLTFKQRVDAANSTGWTNQPKPYNDNIARTFLYNNAYPLSICIIGIWLYIGYIIILRSIKN